MRLRLRRFILKETSRLFINLILLLTNPKCIGIKFSTITGIVVLSYYQHMQYSLQHYQRLSMSRSQPKPKIIFKTLQELIKSSSLSKKNPSIVKEDLKCCTLPLRSVTEASAHSIKRSNSKHSIKSKEKPPQNMRREGSTNKECKMGPSVSYEQVDSEIGKIYEQMEGYLHKSKGRVIDELRGEPGNRKIQAKVKELQKMSDYLKHIIDVFTNQDSQILINQRKVLKETDKQNNNIDALSRNHKKKASSRFLHNSSQKKPSVYQSILNCLN